MAWRRKASCWTILLSVLALLTNPTNSTVGSRGLRIRSLAYAGALPTCELCPQSNPCEASQPAGDGCNTYYFTTWCVDNVWHTNGMGRQTLVYCAKDYVIPNPFEK